MINKIKCCFDDFTFHARVMPVLVVSIPIILMGIFNGLQSKSFASNTIYTLVIIAFISFASRIAREFGKKVQDSIYKKLGAMPTTIILRYSDNRINDVTKTIYHKKLNKIVDEVNLPVDPKDENEDSDVQYEAAINWLRNYANSSRKKEKLVYQELKEYNFWRNLYAMKYIAIAIYFFIGLREYFLNDNFNLNEIIAKPYPQYIAFIIMIFSILIFIFFLRKSTVEKKAFDYAKTLVEVCERI